MIAIPRAATVWPTKGTWSLRTVDGAPTAALACPSCGAVANLSTHSISSTGTVEPSVACEGCDFHEWVVLESWRPN